MNDDDMYSSDLFDDGGPWLLFAYAAVVVLSIAASAIWPYWITP